VTESAGTYSDDLLNTALGLATEWGENFRKPIHDRLREKYPDLTDERIEEITTLVRLAESRIYALAEDRNSGTITESDAARIARAEFPWLDHSNIARLSNIGMYYANR
jgi:hypothetical protein